MRFLPVNLNTILIELDSLDDTLALYASLRAQTLKGITELVPAARTVMATFNPVYLSRQQLIDHIARLPLVNGRASETRTVTVPVRYDGEDLPVLAESLGLSVAQLIEHHQSVNWTVAFTGFAPGFAYMVSADWRRQIPRRATPRTRIPAGALALAGEFSGIYPQASPGGWQLIGSTEEKMWDMARNPPALLQPGAEVRFVDESRHPVISLPAASTMPTKNRGDYPAVLTLLASGLHCSWQDGGRHGQASMGVSESGALDKFAWQEANRLVGNDIHTPVLEITCGGFHARAQTDLVLAVTGAACGIYLHAEGEQRPLKTGRPYALQAGDEIRFDAPTRGLRNYLSIRGAYCPEYQLTSASCDSLAQVGPPPLQQGDSLCVDPHASLKMVGEPREREQTLPASGDVVTLDVVAGPRTDWFDADALNHLTTQSWRVTPQSNRIGLRLDGECPLTRTQHQELPSEGTCTGAIQVPANGQPVLFLNDHPLTGGYPVIAAVAPHHLDLAGQISPGCVIRFNLIQPFAVLLESQNHYE